MEVLPARYVITHAFCYLSNQSYQLFNYDTHNRLHRILKTAIITVEMAIFLVEEGGKYKD